MVVFSFSTSTAPASNFKLSHAEGMGAASHCPTYIKKTKKNKKKQKKTSDSHTYMNAVTTIALHTYNY